MSSNLYDFFYWTRGTADLRNALVLVSTLKSGCLGDNGLPLPRGPTVLVVQGHLVLAQRRHSSHFFLESLLLTTVRAYRGPTPSLIARVMSTYYTQSTMLNPGDRAVTKTDLVPVLMGLAF